MDINNIFIIVFLFIILLSILFGYNNKSNYYINVLLRQSARWSVAAQQDKNPLISVLHANYGAAYLWALKDIATDTEIEKIGNVNIKLFENKIKQIQDTSTKKMAQLCPNYVGDTDKFLATIAGEN